jgi:multicomponent Na+:H+ antiporter subunit B
MNENVVVRTTARLLGPFMMVFGLYVIFHGEGGPGGGFQGGVILASGFILYAIVNGVEASTRILPKRTTDIMAAVGVLLYAGVGVWCMVRGGHFLDYYYLFDAGADPGAAQAMGMTLVEIGVGITVASVMVTLFREFAE